MLPNPSCTGVLRYKDLQDKAGAMHTPCEVSQPPSTPTATTSHAEGSHLSELFKSPHQKFSQMVLAKWQPSFGSLLCKEINWKEERMKRPRWTVTQWAGCGDPSAAMCFTFILNTLRNHLRTFPKTTASLNRRKSYELPHRERKLKLFQKREVDFHSSSSSTGN